MKKEKEEQEIMHRIGALMSNAYEDMQKVRVAVKHRIREVVRRKLEGIGASEVEKKKKKKDYKEKYSDKNLMQHLKKLIGKKGSIYKKEYDYIKMCLDIAEESEKIENKYKKAMMEYIKDVPVYREFLSNVKGMGPVLSANLIKEFGDCEVKIIDRKTNKVIGREKGNKKQFNDAMKKFEEDSEKEKEKRRYIRRGYDTVAKLWANTGNHVIDGIAPKKRKGEPINFSPKLRTLCWKISDCLMKANKGLYRNIYDTEKKKQLNRKYKKGELEQLYGKPYKEKDTKLLKGHAHNRALRKMRKMLLSHYWACARETTGLDTRELYVKEKLGHKHIITWKQALRKET